MRSNVSNIGLCPPPRATPLRAAPVAGLPCGGLQHPPSCWECPDLEEEELPGSEHAPF